MNLKKLVVNSLYIGAILFIISRLSQDSIDFLLMTVSAILAYFAMLIYTTIHKISK